MKRLSGLIVCTLVFILLFSGCGTEKKPEENPISPDPSQTAPTDPFNAAANYAGVWENATDWQTTILVIEPAGNDTFSFSFAAYNFEGDSLHLTAFRANATAKQGFAEYSLAPGSGVFSIFNECCGQMTVSENTLQMTYENLELREGSRPPDLPALFERVSDKSLYAAPFTSCEWPMGHWLTLSEKDVIESYGTPTETIEDFPYGAENPDRDRVLHYEDMSIRIYYPEGYDEPGRITSFETKRGEEAFLRGIHIGDTMDSILSRFPDNSVSDSGERALYGKNAYLESHGSVFYEEGTLVIGYTDGFYWLRFYLGSSGQLERLLLTSTA